MAVLHAAQLLLVPVVAALVLTVVLAPAVHALGRRGLPDALGAGVVVLVLVASAALLILAAAEPAAVWLRKAPATALQVLDRVDRLRAAVPGWNSPQVAAGQPDAVHQRLASEGMALTKTLMGKAVSAAIGVTATLVLLYFLLAAQRTMLSQCLQAMSLPRQRAMLLGGLRAAQRDIGRYLLTLSIVNVVDGVITGLLLWGLGLPDPASWAVVVCVLSFVPYIGPLAIMGLLLLDGINTFSAWPQALAPFLAFVLVHSVETNVVSPWFVGRRLALSPVAVLLAVMFWGWVWGIAGALTAVPLLIGVRIVCRRTRRAPLLCRLLEGGGQQTASHTGRS